jgi:hypothetical protein
LLGSTRGTRKGGHRLRRRDQLPLNAAAHEARLERSRRHLGCETKGSARARRIENGSFQRDALPVPKSRVPEHRFKKVGEVEDVAPGKSKRLEIKLAPGHYVLIYNKLGPHSMGMHTPLTVAPKQPTIVAP